MSSEKFSAVVARFARIFIFAAGPAMLAVFNSGVVISSVSDLQRVSISAMLAGIIAGIAAIDKAIRWQE